MSNGKVPGESRRVSDGATAQQGGWETYLDVSGVVSVGEESERGRRLERRLKTDRPMATIWRGNGQQRRGGAGGRVELTFLPDEANCLAAILLIGLVRERPPFAIRGCLARRRHFPAQHPDGPGPRSGSPSPSFPFPKNTSLLCLRSSSKRADPHFP